MKTVDPYELALSVGKNAFIEKAGFEEMKKAGIRAVELSFGDYDGFDYSKVKTLSDESGVKICSLHLPFMPFEKIDISFLDNTKRKDSVKTLCEIMDKASYIGIDRFIIHASGEPVLPDEREERMKRSMDSLFSLSEFIKPFGARIAVENLPRTCLGNCADEINRLTSVNDNLFVCFDTNHLLKENHREFVNALKTEIITVHISDYDFVDEKHWLPTVGKIDWQEIIGLLDLSGYTGPWLYEVSFLMRANGEEKKLTFADITENYHELFKEKKV